MSRVAAAEIEKALGQKVVVVNQGGASGSIGTRNVLQAPADGYTWAAGAAKDLGTYAVSGMLDTKIADWRFYLHVINVSVLSVTNNAPYKTAQELVDAMKAKPGQVRSAAQASTPRATPQSKRSPRRSASPTSTSRMMAETRPLSRPCPAKPKSPRSSPSSRRR